MAPSSLELLDSRSVNIDDWSRAFSKALQAQLLAYDRVMLPILGRGRLRHLPERNYQLQGRGLSGVRQRVWSFDARVERDWLDIAVAYPLEHIDDWMVLFRQEDLPPELASTLRPPLVPRLRKTLSARTWSIADVCESCDGNLEFTEFLELIDHHRWVRLDHRTDAGTFTIERWQNRTLEKRLQLELDVQLQANISADYPDAEVPLRLDPIWVPPPEEDLALCIADVVDDIYATLRRLCRYQFGLDIDCLGPLLFWRNWPDELCEFDEKEDAPTLDLAAQMARELGEDPQRVAAQLESWLERCVEHSHCELPFFGELRTATLPDLWLEFPDSARDSLLIPGEAIYVAASPDESGE